MSHMMLSYESLFRYLLHLPILLLGQCRSRSGLCDNQCEWNVECDGNLGVDLMFELGLEESEELVLLNGGSRG